MQVGSSSISCFWVVKFELLERDHPCIHRYQIWALVLTITIAIAVQHEHHCGEGLRKARPSATPAGSISKPAMLLARPSSKNSALCQVQLHANE